MSKTNKEYQSIISTPLHVSESEIAIVCQDYTANWITENTEQLITILHGLGIDTTKKFELQPTVQHRNRLHKIVTCARYYGEERGDIEYLQSGYASNEALDKAKNCRMLDSIYRSRGLTEDVLAAAEEKDKWNPWKDEDEVNDD